jgi:hypothetical protein
MPKLAAPREFSSGTGKGGGTKCPTFTNQL